MGHSRPWELPGKSESTNLNRDTLSREIGRISGAIIIVIIIMIIITITTITITTIIIISVNSYYYYYYYYISWVGDERAAAGLQ